MQRRTDRFKNEMLAAKKDRDGVVDLTARLMASAPVVMDDKFILRVKLREFARDASRMIRRPWLQLRFGHTQQLGITLGRATPGDEVN